MALVNSSFTVNVTPGAMPPTVHVSEYDIGRTYTVTINGQNGSAFNIPTGTTATVEGTLNGAIGFTTGATISGSTVSFTLTESMTAKSGKAWCKIKLALNNEPIQTCAFVLAVDRAGVEADTVIGADGFEQQIVDAVNDWLDAHPPASGGVTEEFKQALLDCFENVAWINDDGQTYYDALYAALHPPVDVLSISAVFTQGSAVIYETDSLDTLKQYLTVTATYDDSSTGVVTNYTLSGTLTVGTSTITVSYGGKTTTFNVTVVLGLDSIAFGSMTYRDIFITNNLVDWYGDFENGFVVSSNWTYLEPVAPYDNAYKLASTASPSVTTSQYNSPSHSLNVSANGESKYINGLSHDWTFGNAILIAFACNIPSYTSGRVELQAFGDSDAALIKATRTSTTDGWEPVVAIGTPIKLSNKDYISCNFGALSYNSVQAVLTAYIDDLVMTPLPSGMTQAEAETLFANYMAMRARGDS